MSSKKRRIKRRKIKSKRHRHILLILFLVIIGTFFLYNEFSKEPVRPLDTLKEPQPEKEERSRVLPRMSLVLDDLGPSKRAALRALGLNASVTLSILPQETFSDWIAEEGHRRGFEIIGHIPMEAETPHKLGKGGLYTWMTDEEIRETLGADIKSIPHISGVSNHMGSAFTEDERAMSVVMSVINEHGLFFLDSLTTSNSICERVAAMRGVKILKRDIFLDNEDNPNYIRSQWDKAIKRAMKKGYVIVLAHPRKNTIEFLKERFAKNEVEIVPLSELLAPSP
jgi:hypothetical protein